MPYLYLIAGLVILVVGGEFLVRGAVGMARKLRVSTLVIGMTVVSLGTSAPELLVSIKAALSGHPDISIGNVIGSNIANIALVLGLTIIIFPIIVERQTLTVDWPAMFIASILFYIFILDTKLDLWEGVVFVVLLVSFVWWMVWRSRREHPDPPVDEEVEQEEHMPIWKTASYVVGGCVGLMLGADWLLEGAVTIATKLGISEHVIGVTIVAFGTSVPELATSCIAAFRKQTDISVGNLIGSNLFNILAILGITSIVKEIPVNETVLNTDIFWMLGVSLLLLPLMLFFKKLNRVHGVLFVAIYVTYVVVSLER